MSDVDKIIAFLENATTNISDFGTYWILLHYGKSYLSMFLWFFTTMSALWLVYKLVLRLNYSRERLFVEDLYSQHFADPLSPPYSDYLQRDLDDLRKKLSKS